MFHLLWQEIVFSGGSHGGLQGKLVDRLAVSPEGDVAVVSSGFRPGQDSRIWLATLRRD